MSRSRLVRTALTVAVLAATGTWLGARGSAPEASAATESWLSIVNSYRAMSGLGPVTEHPEWSTEARQHGCYMLQNGISHDEVPGKPGYTPGGDTAGNSGNVAVSSAIGATPRDHIDLWMTGPFHAIGVLRHNLTRSGFGICTDPDTSPWRSGATLDVIRGLQPMPRPSTPIVFPGRGSAIPLDRFITESPNPLTLCGWTGEAGLPLIAMMPSKVTSASASLVGPAGPIDVCVLHPGNTGADATARAILDGDNAVVVVPRVRLSEGDHRVTVTSSGGDTTWSFEVDLDAELTRPSIEVPDTEPLAADARFRPVTPFRHSDSRAGLNVVRLRAAVPQSVRVAEPFVTAVSANFTIDRPSSTGYLTVYSCEGDVPVVSTLNFVDRPVPNQAVVPLDEGRLCLTSPVDTDVIIDVNGYFRSGDGTGFTPVASRRLLDTRAADVAALRADVPRAIRIGGVPGGVPLGADAVAVNLTVTRPAADGFLEAYPCDQPAPGVSNVNFVAGQDRPNSAIVRLSVNGTICLRSSVPTDVIVDVTGHFTDASTTSFTPLRAIRVLDTRSPYAQLDPRPTGGRPVPGEVVELTIAGTRGVPDDAVAVSVNLTATDAGAVGYVTAYPCGDRPTVSTLNVEPGVPAVANGAMVELDDEGRLCLYTNESTHLLVDINGVWR